MDEKSTTFAVIGANGTFFDAVESSMGPVYGVALCVGSILIKPAHLTQEREFEHTMDLNLKSAFGLVRSATKRMIKRGSSIVLVSSCPQHSMVFRPQSKLGNRTGLGN